jgi:hypothetical protein
MQLHDCSKPESEGIKKVLPKKGFSEVKKHLFLHFVFMYLFNSIAIQTALMEQHFWYFAPYG